MSYIATYLYCILYFNIKFELFVLLPYLFKELKCSDPKVNLINGDYCITQ